jgi:hypothetical protein
MLYMEPIIISSISEEYNQYKVYSKKPCYDVSKWNVISIYSSQLTAILCFMSIELLSKLLKITFLFQIY